jgi:ABC-type Mn/Zn transport systems, ATPase component
MYDIINELNKSNMTIIMISHDIKVALEYATKVLYIGEHIFFGTTPEYKKSRGMA